MFSPKKPWKTASQHRYPPTRESYMSAQFLGDEEKCAELCKQLFLDEGWIEHLEGARKHAEAAGGWRTSFPWAATLMLAQPADPNWPFVLLNTLTNLAKSELGVTTELSATYSNVMFCLPSGTTFNTNGPKNWIAFGYKPGPYSYYNNGKFK